MKYRWKYQGWSCQSHIITLYFNENNTIWNNTQFAMKCFKLYIIVYNIIMKPNFRRDLFLNI